MNARDFKALLKRNWHACFRRFQRIGVNVVPEHFYSGIPDLADLARRTDWRRPRSMHGIDQRSVDDQITLLGEWLQPHDDWLRSRSVHDAAIRSNGGDGGYGDVEGDVLFGFVATRAPRRIIQIGCGVSTAIVLAAAERAGYRPDILCVEPYPSAFLAECAAAGLVRLIAQPAQLVDTHVLGDLDEGHLLFIDSTHTVKPGSEVNYLVHEVLPRLSAGVWVHFHDIYFPYDYSRATLGGDLFFPQENALLYAFLTCNRRYRLEACLSMLHYAAAEELGRLIPRYVPASQVDGLELVAGGHFPSAAWLRVVGE